MVRHHGTSIVVGVLFLAFGLTLGYRMSRLAVTSQPDGTLRICNSLGTRSVKRSDIEEFRIGSSAGRRIGQRSILVLLRDGSIYGLNATRMTPFGLGSKRPHQQLALLKEWLHAGG